MMNGPSAAREIRRLGHDTFIVGVTGNMLDDDVDYFRNAGANHVLAKPLRLGDLVSVWTQYGIKCTSETRLEI